MSKIKTVVDERFKIYCKRLLIGIVIYAILVVAFYFLAGDNLHFRQSRGNLAMPSADTFLDELTEGKVLEQVFSAKIQRLESVSVLWANYDRENAGTLTVELCRVDDGIQVMSGQFNVAELGDYQTLSLRADPPIETVYDMPLRLRVFADSQPGSAGSLFACATAQGEGFSLTENGVQVEGGLCFAAQGTDFIWLGKHYWLFAGVLGAVLVFFFLLVWYRARSGRHSYIINAFIALDKYSFLIRTLVSRDFKVKYKRSILGVFWSFLNPLLMMVVQYYVFSTLFNPDIPNFGAYLIIGTVMFNFFSESVGLALSSILDNAGLITKVYMPKYVYPLTRVLSSLINLAISCIPMLIVCLITGVHFHKSAILGLYFLCCLVMFCLGMGLLLSTSMVFFRDTQFLWSVVNMMWMYATPIFYPERILPDNLRKILNFNPLYHFIKSVRICILDGVSPEPRVYIQCMLFALGAVLVGAVVFKKHQDKFVLYL